MKVEVAAAKKWLEEPVTRAMIEAMEALENEQIKSLSEGGCIGLDKLSVSDAYHTYMGNINALRLVKDPLSLLKNMGFIKEGEDE